MLGVTPSTVYTRMNRYHASMLSPSHKKFSQVHVLVSSATRRFTTSTRYEYMAVDSTHRSCVWPEETTESPPPESNSMQAKNSTIECATPSPMMRSRCLTL